MRTQTVETARGKWKGILEALGVDSKYLRNVHGPCPICKGGKDRWRWDDKLNGNFFCSQCGAGDGFTLLQKLNGWDFARTAAEVDKIVGTVQQVVQRAERTEAQKLAAIKALLHESTPLDSTPALRYLERRCGALDPSNFVSDLRAHPNASHSREWGSFPALLAVLRYPDGTGASVHRTYLTPDGRKANVDPVRKIMSGRPLVGSAVRLGPILPHIGIAEGLETALCASKAFGLPVWAAISAGGMVAWVPPPGIQAVTIFGDNDASFTGQAAAFTLARRLVKDGLAVDVQIPSTIGTDWADVQMQKVS